MIRPHPVTPRATRLAAVIIAVVMSAVPSHSQNATPPIAPVAPVTPPSSPATGFHDVVNFKNGDKLTGRLFTMTPGAQLEWHSPYFNQLIRFPYETVDTIVCPRPDPTLVVPEAERSAILLTNEDLVIGKLVALDEKILTLAVPYSKPLSIRRSAIKSIHSRISSTGSMYFGPKSTDKWEAYHRHNMPWRLENNKLVSVSGGTIFNPIPIGSDVRVQFDASWNQVPAFWVGLGAPENRDQSGSIIQLILNGPSVQIRETQHLGNNQYRSAQIGAVIPLDFQNKSQARFTVVVAAASKTVALLINGTEVQKVELSAILPAKSNGIVFGSTGQSQIEIKNIEVLSLVTDTDPKAQKRADSEKTDISVMANNDTVPGNIVSIQNDLVTIKSPRGDLNFPIDRIRAIGLKPTGQERARLRPTDVRLWTDSSDHITLSLERIDAQGITGISENFGRVTFHRGAFTRIEFQIHDPATKRPK